MPSVQGSALEWFLDCVIPVSWLALAAGSRFTQPRDHSLSYFCISNWPDVLEAEELRHLRPLVDLLHVDGRGVEGVGHVAKQHAVPAAKGKGNKFEIKFRYSMSKISKDRLLVTYNR